MDYHKRFSKIEGKAEGYAVLWNTKAFVPQDGVHETFERGSLKLLPDRAVGLYVQHNERGVPLANSKAGTLKFENRPEGLWFEADIDPDRKDVLSALRRKDLSGVSVHFGLIDARYDGKTRTIKKALLKELSFVDNPVHQSGGVSLRNKSFPEKKLKWNKLIIGV